MEFDNNINTNYSDWLHHLGGEGGVDVWFTSRGGVIDGDPYSGFNVCHYVDDNETHVNSCRNMLCDKVVIEQGSLIIPRQTHSANVIFIDRLPVNINELEGVDAVVTNLPDVAIGVSTADCVPVALYDVSADIIGVAHAGWKGALAGVVENTIDEMLNHGATVQNIKALFGPSICVDCFEVGEEVAERFPGDCVERRPEWVRPHVNLHHFLSERMIAKGVRHENITDFNKELCTKCHPHQFFSARNLGIKSGRNFTFIRRTR